LGRVRPVRLHLHARAHRRPGLLHAVQDGVHRGAVGAGQREDSDGAGQDPGDEVVRGGVEVGVALLQLGGRGVEVGAQGVLLRAELLHLARQLVADGLLQRAGAQRDADGEREEDRDERDEVISEVDHWDGGPSV